MKAGIQLLEIHKSNVDVVSVITDESEYHAQYMKPHAPLQTVKHIIFYTEPRYKKFHRKHKRYDPFRNLRQYDLG